MKILALEFSSSQRSVAVVDSAIAEAGAGCIRGVLRETGERSRQVIGLVDHVLTAAGWERENVDVIAIGLGPGSYTGIRAALALAQGWQIARPMVHLWGESSVACCAATARENGWRGRYAIVVDAQRNEFYWAVYHLGDTVCQEIEPLRLVSSELVAAAQQNGVPMAGPDLSHVMQSVRDLYPDAGMLGRLAVGRADFTRGDRLEPIYLRAVNFVKAPPPRVILQP